uniref:Uncharacterized protein n=1 Tax=Anguilla anguilla TaxID=7936 RepID=A0A0E9UTJ0_ANGAN
MLHFLTNSLESKPRYECLSDLTYFGIILYV